MQSALHHIIAKYEASLKGDEIASHRFKVSKALLKGILGQEGHLFIAPIIVHNTTQPYHNVQHCLTVMNHSLALLATSQAGSTYQAQRLALAALFHDFQHSAGETDDAANVQRAIAGMRMELGPYFNPEFLDDVSSIIAVTQYPFIREPRTLAEQCIRDADLMQNFELDAPKFRAGLAQEMGMPVTLKGTLQFLGQQVFYTEPGKQVASQGLAALAIEAAKMPMEA